LSTKSPSLLDGRAGPKETRKRKKKKEEEKRKTKVRGGG
jgi:hypothetical protein